MRPIVIPAFLEFEATCVVEVGLGTGEIVDTETWDEIVVCAELEDEILERVCEIEEDFGDEGDVIREELDAEVTPEVIDWGIANEEVEGDDINVSPDVAVDLDAIVVDDDIEMEDVASWLVANAGWEDGVVSGATISAFTDSEDVLVAIELDSVDENESVEATVEVVALEGEEVGNELELELELDSKWEFVETVTETEAISTTRVSENLKGEVWELVKELPKLERELKKEVEVETEVARAICFAVPRDELKVERVLNLAKVWKEELVTTDAEVFAIEQDELDVAPEMQGGVDGITGAVEERIWECGVIGSEIEVLTWACCEDGDGSEVVEVEVRHSNVQLVATIMTLKNSSHILDSLKSKPFFWISCFWLALCASRDDLSCRILDPISEPAVQKVN
jgi:hypothetical protein